MSGSGCVNVTLAFGGPQLPATDALSDDALLDQFQRAAFGYFLDNVNPANGLVADTSRPGSTSSTAVVGFALSCYPIAVERGWMDRQDAAQRCVTTLQFLLDLPQGDQPGAAGDLSFFYHFLDMETGRRANNSELSVIDTALLMAGVLTAGAYFSTNDGSEKTIRRLSERLYGRVNWCVARERHISIRQGWNPLDSYNEAMIMAALAFGSPTHSLPGDLYAEWTKAFRWEPIVGQEMVYAGPLFIHQFSQAWIDFDGIQDDFMKKHGSDYFINSRRATQAHREYARQNPHGFAGYDQDLWGLSAGDGPGDMTVKVGNREQQVFGYAARGVPFGPDDGTVAPWSCLASLPFTPELSISALRHLVKNYPQAAKNSMISSGINLTMANHKGFGPEGWISEGYFGLDQGIIVLMIENYRSGLIWQLMRSCTHVRNGLRKAGFSGGWLD